ncbi:hypothetical protein BPOR_0184g00160 [Botrytis porri]|uniref:Uncharacterized protein n=1 Tax=Botrytis porri TaxID=87229 RepID=A0A4Z1KUI8_9HELO|nr:hypothetical protein BPOR_0184g00160 [Botrytis porri]
MTQSMNKFTRKSHYNGKSSHQVQMLGSWSKSLVSISLVGEYELIENIELISNVSTVGLSKKVGSIKTARPWLLGLSLMQLVKLVRSDCAEHAVYRTKESMEEQN